MKQISFLKGIIIISIVAVITYPLYVLFYIYPSFHKLIINEKENDAQQIVHYLVQNADLLETLINKKNKYPTEEQVEKIVHFSENFNLIKTRVFSNDGTIIYSTKNSEIDNVNTKQYFNLIVKKGIVFSKYVKKGKMSAEGNEILIDVVEVYVPVMSNGKFDGAVEIYYDITPILKDYKRLFSESNFIIIIIALVLLLSILVNFLKAYTNINARIIAEKEVQKHNEELKNALDEIKTLEGILPICSYCKKVRDDEGYWQQVGDYIHNHSNANVSHGVCPTCVKEHFPNMKELHKRLGL